jgi:glyoxylase-like metal-dependent hydrolase (beta-lactamase superfamily II)
VFTPDRARNRESIRRVAALEPALICFGHGPPLRDTAKLARFVATLN